MCVPFSMLTACQKKTVSSNFSLFFFQTKSNWSSGKSTRKPHTHTHTPVLRDKVPHHRLSTESMQPVEKMVKPNLEIHQVPIYMYIYICFYIMYICIGFAHHPGTVANEGL